MRLCFAAVVTVSILLLLPPPDARAQRIDNPPDISPGTWSPDQQSARMQEKLSRLALDGSAAYSLGPVNAPMALDMKTKLSGGLRRDAVSGKVVPGQAFRANDLPVVGVGIPVGHQFDLSAAGVTGLSGARPFSNGILRSEGGKVSYTLAVESVGAAGLRIQISGMDLPDGAELYVYSLHGATGQVVGPYTGKGPMGTGEFWTNTIFDSTAFLELQTKTSVADASPGRLGFKIENVAHLGGPEFFPGSLGAPAAQDFNLDCLLDANCVSEEWPESVAGRDAIAMMLFPSTELGQIFFFLCTGSLVNDIVPGSFVPYFLTANHCINAPDEAAGLECFFRFYTFHCSKIPDDFDPFPSESSSTATSPTNASPAAEPAPTTVAQGTTLPLNFTINYKDSPGEGFNDPLFGAKRKAAFEFAVGIWATALEGSIPVVVDATFDSLGGDAFSAILGQAGPNTVVKDFTGAVLPNTWYVTSLGNQMHGSDLDPGKADVVAQFNSDVDNSTVLGGISWYYGTDGHPPGQDVDFVSTVLHELGHGLGFLDLIDSGSGHWLADVPDVFGRQLTEAGVGDFDAITDPQRFGALTSGAVFWKGDDVVTSHSGQVLMYAPNPYEPGSSISHWDPSNTPDLLMEPFDTGTHHSLDLTVPALQDIGWSAALAVPTPTPVPVAPDPETLPTTLGAVILAHGEAGPKSDFSLLKLAEDPPPGSVFLGWTNRIPTVGTQLFRLSHPAGKPLNFTKQIRIIPFFDCTDLPNAQFLHTVHFEGSIQGGSSGSPLMTVDLRIVGQLFGWCGNNFDDICATEFADLIDGRFSKTFPLVERFINNPGPDLRVMQLALTRPSPPAGVPLQAKVRIRNWGRDLASNFVVGLYFDLPAAPGCGQAPNLTSAPITLGPGQATMVVFDFVAPPTVGIHGIHAFADSSCQVFESNEANNVRGIAYRVR